jgi:hypothetical protein
MIFKKRQLLMVLVLACVCSVSACAQDVDPVKRPAAKNIQEAKQPAQTPSTTAPRPEADPGKFAIIVCGIGGEPAYTTQFSTWANALRTELVDKLSFAPNQTALLVEKPSSEFERPATTEELRRVFSSLKATTKADSSVFIFLIGHGSFSDKEAKFMLVGPDLTAKELALHVKSLPTRHQVIINMSSASGEFIKPLSASGAIVIAATRSGQEQNATRFPEYFVSALTKTDADADKNGRVSVGEAFAYATRMTAAFYEGEGRLATEHALLDDNGDGVGHPKAEAGDGGLALTTFFDSLPKMQAGGDVELAKLFEERARLEGEIAELKAGKEKKKKTEAEYDAELEKLLVELATVSQKIRSKQK